MMPRLAGNALAGEVEDPRAGAIARFVRNGHGAVAIDTCQDIRGEIEILARAGEPSAHAPSVGRLPLQKSSGDEIVQCAVGHSD